MTISRNLSFLAEGVSSTGVLGATYGGTGQSSITTGDLLYGSATNIISKLAIGSTGTILRVVSGVPAWGTDYTGTVTSVAALTLGTTGTDLSSTVANGTTTPVITLNVPTASATNRGVLSSADWTTFNNKGSGSVTSVAATVPAFLSISGSPITTSGTLAITYSGTALPVANGGTGLVSLTAGYIPYGNGTSALSSSSGLTTNGSNLTATGSITGGSLVTTGGGTLNGSFSVGSTGYPQFVASAGSAAYLKIDATVNGGGQLWRIGDGIYNFGIFSIYNQTANLFPLNVFASGGVSIGNATDPGATNLSVTGSISNGGTSTFSSSLFKVGVNTANTGPGATNSLYGYRNSSIGWNIQNNATTNGYVIQLTSGTVAGTGWNFIDAYSDIFGTPIDQFRVVGNGNVVNTNNSYGSISDAKLKQNISLSSSQWSDVKELGQIIKKYSLISDETNTLQLGWIAQDVQNISPKLVFSTADKDVDGNDLGTETLGIHYSVAYMKAFKALSEAMIRIEQLETRLAAANIG